MQCIFYRIAFAVLLLIRTVFLINAQPAVRITHPAAQSQHHKVLHFRKLIGFQQKPEKFIVYLSADSPHRFYVNGKIAVTNFSVSALPNAIEKIDIAPFLQTGKNLLAAIVWQDSKQDNNVENGFFLEGQTTSEEIVNTGNAWKVLGNQAFDLNTADTAYVAGELFSGNSYPWGWEYPEYDDSYWMVPVNAREQPKREQNDRIFLPVLTEEIQKINTFIYTKQPAISLKTAFFSERQELQIPADTTVSFLADQGFQANACPALLISGGLGAKITLGYIGETQNNEITYQDIWLPDGGEKHIYRTNHFRNFRQLQISVTTHSQPLAIHDFYALIPAYALPEKAFFHSDDTLLNSLWQSGIRATKRVVFDVGSQKNASLSDSLMHRIRLQSLTFLYLSGEEFLLKNNIRQIYNLAIADSLNPEKLSLSLEWLAMLHDFWLYRMDDSFVKAMLPGIGKVLKNGQEVLLNHNLPEKKSYLYSSDEPGKVSKSNSILLKMRYILGLQQAIELYGFYGMKNEVAASLQVLNFLKTAVFQQYWSQEKKYLGDNPEKTSFSRLTQAMAVLAGIVPEKEKQLLLNNILSDNSLSKSSLCEILYIWKALQKSGYNTEFFKNQDLLNGNNYLKDAQVCDGVNYELLLTIAGILPGNAGFKTVKIEPVSAKLTSLEASILHPEGIISVKYYIQNGRLSVEVMLPKSINGEFIWKGKRLALKAGKNRLNGL